MRYWPWRLPQVSLSQVEEPTEWIAPAFFVKKSDPTKARMVTDFTALNRHVVRPVHPFPSPQDVIRSISSTSKVFAKLDATSGYFQIPLDEESSRLTTFLLPSGRYRYTRAPMGLSSSSDEFCQRSDAAVRDLPGVIKIVDDILVQASSVAELKERLTAVLKRCRAHGITLSKGKVYAGTSVKFAGFIVTASGVKPDPAKVKAIIDFPAPKDISGVRSFLGLANQLGHFVPNLAMVTDSLRRLLKKDTAWNWTPEIQASFDKTKELLSGELSVVPFSSKSSTTLFTDASCINGWDTSSCKRAGSSKQVQGPSLMRKPGIPSLSWRPLPCHLVNFGMRALSPGLSRLHRHD
jgi:hypothetical protein